MVVELVVLGVVAVAGYYVYTRYVRKQTDRVTDAIDKAVSTVKDELKEKDSKSLEQRMREMIDEMKNNPPK